MNLILGDCLEVMKSIPDGSIDAIITDPPYGTTACKWDSVIDFKLMWEQLNRIIKPNGAIVLFGSEPFSSALRMSNIKNYKYDWIWNKVSPSGHLNAKIMPMKSHELVSVFYNKPPTYNQQRREPNENSHGRGTKYLNVVRDIKESTYGAVLQSKENKSADGLCSPISIIKFSRGNGRNTLHPTQKPIALMEYLIKTYTNENETVLDFTMGSGSTGVAAKNLNRNFIGIEQDENYFKIAEQRIKETEYKLFL